MTEKERENYTPAHLGRRSADAIDAVDLIPWHGGEITVTLVCDEFTSLCPVTEQPDFGGLEIIYRPKKSLIETKSLKLYLLKFRNKGVFSESLVDQIADELCSQIDPEWLLVKGEFNSRGGIGIEVEAERGETRD